MPSTNRPSGGWSRTEEEHLKDLIKDNIVDYRNRNPDYLLQITEEHFPDFISSGAAGRNAAIQRMRGKFLKYEQDIELRGARRQKIRVLISS